MLTRGCIKKKSSKIVHILILQTGVWMCRESSTANILIQTLWCMELVNIFTILMLTLELWCIETCLNLLPLRLSLWFQTWHLRSPLWSIESVIHILDSFVSPPYCHCGLSGWCIKWCTCMYCQFSCPLWSIDYELEHVVVLWYYLHRLLTGLIRDAPKLVTYWYRHQKAS